jgi:hypothetical protein
MDNNMDTNHAKHLPAAGGGLWQLAPALQRLTGPIFKILRWSELADVWQLADAWHVSYSTLAEALASRAWLELDFPEQRQDYMDDHADALPYAILELHPERGVQQYAIVCTGAEQVEAWAYGADAERVAYRLGLIARAD